MSSVDMHRRKSLRYGTLLLVCAGLWAASPGAPAQEGLSDPVRLGLMQGFPPAPEKRVDKTNSLQFPQIRWSLRHSRERAPTAGIRRAHEPVPLAVAPIGNLDEISFHIGQREVTLANYLRDTHTDGFIVLHDGRVVYERYFDSFGPRQMHVWASMTKSVTGLIAAMLIEEGVLDPDARLAHYVPELAGSPFGEATVQQNLDMEVDVRYPASLPPDLGLFGAVGFVPRREGAPDNIYDFLKVARGATPSAGDTWYYQNGSPEAVAWAMRRVTGQSWTALVSDRLWSKFAEDEAYVLVDPIRTEMASGGMSSTLRDAARFAEWVRKANATGSPELISSGAVHTFFKPHANQARFAKGNLAQGRSGYSYRNYWYQVNDGDGSIEASGRFGQWIHINPKTALTIVKFSSNPDSAPRATTAGSGSPGRRRPEDTAEALGRAAKAILSAIER